MPEAIKTILNDLASEKAYYRFEGGVTDSSPNGFNGTSFGTPTFGTAKFGQGITYASASSQRTDIDSTTVASSSTYTVSLWFSTSNTTEGVFWSNGRSSSDNPFSRITIGNPAAGRIYWEFRDDAATLGSITSAGTYNDGLWHCVQAVRRAANSWALYVDGALVGTSTTTLSTTTIDRATIGALRRNTSILYANATIDDLIIFTAALTPNQLKDLNEGRYIGELAVDTSAKAVWSMNGHSTDRSGNYINGSDTSITYSQANGKIGQGGGFNGTTSKSTISAPLTGTGAMTIVGWIKTTTNTGRKMIISWGSTSTNQHNFLSMNAGKLQYEIWAQTAVASTGLINTGAWVLFATTHPGGTGTQRLYINGIIDGTTTYTPNLGSTAAMIGRRGDDPSEFITAAIDELGVYSREWTQQEMKKYLAWGTGRLM